MKDSVAEREADEASSGEDEPDGEGSNMLTCAKCKKRYRSSKFYEKHIEKCENSYEEKTVMDRAINMSLDMLTTGELVPYQRNRVHPRLKDMTVIGQFVNVVVVACFFGDSSARPSALSTSFIRSFLFSFSFFLANFCCCCVVEIKTCFSLS